MQSERYTTGLLVALAVAVCALALPAYLHFVAMRLPGFELPAFLQTIGFVEARLSLIFAVTVGLFVLGFSAFHWRAVATLKGLVLLAISAGALTAGPVWYYRANIVENRPAQIPTPAFSDLDMMEIRRVSISHPAIQAAYDRDSIPPAALDSFRAFHSYALKLYGDAAPIIASDWGIESETVRRTAFYAAVVGSLFEYGNRDRPDLAGCTDDNELLGGPITYVQSQRQFLSSSIGCCNDYAYLMKTLLDLDGVPNRMLLGQGHIWNEFTVDGQTYNVDANTGVLVASSWASLKDADKLLLWRIPIAGAMPSSGERYRPRLGVFTAWMVTKIAMGGFPVSVWTEIPRKFPLEDGGSQDAALR